MPVTQTHPKNRTVRKKKCFLGGEKKNLLFRQVPPLPVGGVSVLHHHALSSAAPLIERKEENLTGVYCSCCSFV